MKLNRGEITNNREQVEIRNLKFEKVFNFHSLGRKTNDQYEKRAEINKRTQWGHKLFIRYKMFTKKINSIRTQQYTIQIITDNINNNTTITIYKA